jgi:ATP-dependent helicase Lhr and Lhr-like helicase
VGPTWSVASRVQRVGRSGRKEDESQVLRLFTLDREINAHSPLGERLRPELIRAIALVELLIARWVEPPGAFRRWNFSTLIHQILSVLRQTGGMTLTDLYEQLCQNGAFHGIDRKDFLLLLRNLKEKTLLDQMTSGEVILAPGGEQIVEDRSFYASFVTPVEYTV